jgi:NitT/TauT family transport system ATP-binding protein
MSFVQKDKDERTRERVAKYLDMVGLSDFKNAYPAQLSGGMQQRVGIARAFSIEPDALLMDEPFSHLDAITARSLRHQLHDMWKATGKTVLFVTHDVGEAVELSNRIIVFAKGGKIKEDLQIDLPFPRHAADENVAITKAHVLQKFEELELVAT